MISIAYLRRALNWLLVLMWTPAAAWAASIAHEDELAAISMTVLALTFSLSTLSGSAALVWRLNQELAKITDGRLPRLWLFIASNLLGSWTAGALAWVVALSQGMSVWPMLATVILSSFGGARFIEGVAERYMAKARGDADAAG